MPVDLESDLRNWGNSIGLVIPAAVAKKYGLKAGQHVRLQLEVDLPRNDPGRLPTWDLQVPVDSHELDDFVADDIAEGLDRIYRKGHK